MNAEEKRKRGPDTLRHGLCAALAAVLFVACPVAFTWAGGVVRGTTFTVAAADGETASPAGAPGDEDFSDDFPDEEVFVEISDPLEPLNRGIFWVNDKLYFFLLKPIAKGFRVVPEPVRTPIANFFRNLATPIRFVNSLLQGKGVDAGNELGRFLANTTIGIGGLFDPAKTMTGIGPKDEDFGQTLGYYGVGQGFYLVLPLLGPSSLRDGIGRVGDLFADPLFYLSRVGVDDATTVAVGAKALELEVGLSLDKDTYESIKRESLDPYLTVRDAYAQRRDARVKE